MSARPVQPHWFVWLNGKCHGPYPFTTLIEGVAKGIITGDISVWRHGWANPARHVRRLFDEPLEEAEADRLTLTTIRPHDVATYIEERQATHSAPDVKQQLAAVRMMFELADCRPGGAG
jgi:GYF domain 2